MSSTIPESLIGMEQKLTADQISMYKIIAGPGGTWVREWYVSARPELSDYRFYLRSVVMDEKGYYYLTIHPNTDDPTNP
jgi:hypothetical protein